MRVIVRLLLGAVFFLALLTGLNELLDVVMPPPVEHPMFELPVWAAAALTLFGAIGLWLLPWRTQRTD